MKALHVILYPGTFCTDFIFLYFLLVYSCIYVLTRTVLVTPDGMTIESEAAHGTVTRHWRDYNRGLPTSTNPIACVFAWTRGLQHRAHLDHNVPLANFLLAVEDSVVATVEKGIMTRDLAGCLHGWDNLESLVAGKDYVYTEEFLDHVREELERELRATMPGRYRKEAESP